MSKLNFFGLISIVGGGVTLLFQTIASMMTAGEITWKKKTLAGVFGEEKFLCIQEIPVVILQNAAEWIVGSEIYLLLFVTGFSLIAAKMALGK